jgi:hypothetical protein
MMPVLYRNFLPGLLLGILGGAAVLRAADVDGELFARTCLVVEEHADATDAEGRPLLFSEESRPGPDKQLSLYLDAGLDVYVLVAAFRQGDGRPVLKWAPEWVRLEPWQELQLPTAAGSEPWTWAEDSGPFDIHLFFLGVDHPGLDGFVALIQAMRAPGTDPALLERQSLRLREMMDAAAAQLEPVRFDPAVTPRAWGGTLRGAKFPWRQLCQKISLDSDGSGYFVYPVPSA